VSLVKERRQAEGFGQQELREMFGPKMEKVTGEEINTA
jgi:hypothetical protein